MIKSNVSLLFAWVSTIPNHWQVCRLGSIANITLSNVDKHTIEGEVGVQLCNYIDVYKNDRITSKIEFMQASALPREIEKFQIKKGDILATKDSENPNDIAVSALIDEHLPGVLCGYHLAIIRPSQTKIFSNFLAWVHKSKEILAQYEAQAMGVTRFALGQSTFKEAIVPLPPISEQRRIAAYLDQQTAKIDRLVDLRRRQIALLKEQRAALIQQVVTRGLNPNVPMKDSGLLWLGEIPAHWEIKRLKYLSKINPSIPRVRIPKSTDEASFLPMERIGQDGSLDLSEKRIVNDISHGYTPMINGDVIVAKITPCFENGKGALCTNLIGGIGFGTTELIVLRANYEIDPRFLFWRTWCRDFRKLGESEMQGSAGQKRVTEDFISNFYLAKPPVKEQQEIIEFIKNQNIQFEKLNLSYSRQITLLTEYRAALIHECVTGRRQINDTFALEAK